MTTKTTKMTIVTTTIMKSPLRVLMPQFQSSPLAPHIISSRNIKEEPVPFSPPATLTKGQTDTIPLLGTPSTPVSPSAPNHVGKGKGVDTSMLDSLHSHQGQALWYHIPHPDDLCLPADIFLHPKKWHIVTISQEVGVFPSWYFIFLLRISSYISTLGQAGCPCTNLWHSQLCIWLLTHIWSSCCRVLQTVSCKM